VLAVALALTGCAADSISDGVIEPSFDDKSDIYSDIAAAESLDFGDRAEGVFDRDLQFFAYKFHAADGAKVSAEVTQRGSSRDLDTTMFLYRLADGAHPTRIASDDDEGWGSLSEIADFELYSEASYAVIIGTKDGAGRGSFGIELRCENGACTVPEPACDSARHAEIMECVADNAGEYGYEAELHEVLADACMPTDDDCRVWAERAYPPTVGRTVGFLQLAPDPAIEAIVDRVNGSDACPSGDDYGCEFRLAAYEYDTDYSITVEELMAHARLSAPPGPGLFATQNTGESAASDARAFTDVVGITDDLPGLINLLGATPDNASYGRASSRDISWNYGDCGGTMVVADFPDEGLALEMSVFYCSG